MSEVAGLGLGGVDVSAVPHRRVVALARYGMAAKATALRRHPEPRRLATLVATVRSLEAKAVDDALELFDVLMTNDLLARAARESRNEKLRRYPRLAKDAGKLAAAVGVLLDALEHEEQLSLDLVWEEIESKVSRADLRAAVAHLMEVAPPADADPDGEWRTALVDRFASVRAFAALLCETIEFGATAQAAGVLAAMNTLPGLLDARATVAVPTGYLDARRVAEDVVPAGWWRRLVYSADRPEGTVDRAAYVFCVLEQFHRHLLRRDIYASPSARWGDPRSKLLTGPAWDAAKGPALNALGLPEDPRELLAEHAQELDGAWRALSDGLVADSEVHVDSDGRLHADKI
ncbi:MAG: Tn3 family transposase, partial [Solirubrobacterales bacterium]|nr:Tn3 family transposase [Solirubrobacterales bacterium]